MGRVGPSKGRGRARSAVAESAQAATLPRMEAYSASRLGAALCCRGLEATQQELGGRGKVSPEEDMATLFHQNYKKAFQPKTRKVFSQSRI
jgi:hypothetical protein